MRKRVDLSLFGWKIRLRLSTDRVMRWPEIREQMAAGGAIVCVSRCYYCGHPTNHEICHEHSDELNPSWQDALPTMVVPDIEGLWGSRDGEPPEVCTDPACPAWEPDEAAALARRQEEETVIVA